MTRRRYEIIATTFDKKGRVIASGVNSYSKTHPLMKYFSEIAGESEHKASIHAELNACLKSGDKEIDSILVQRFDLQGKPKLAKPCRTCQVMLKAMGVKTVRYTTEEGVKEYEVL